MSKACTSQKRWVAILDLKQTDLETRPSNSKGA